MFSFRRFPYTDFNQMNLDWLISVVPLNIFEDCIFPDDFYAAASKFNIIMLGDAVLMSGTLCYSEVKNIGDTLFSLPSSIVWQDQKIIRGYMPQTINIGGNTYTEFTGNAVKTISGSRHVQALHQIGENQTVDFTALVSIDRGDI